jgi:prepilin-type processing-associated H-X9-DG protein
MCPDDMQFGRYGGHYSYLMNGGSCNQCGDGLIAYSLTTPLPGVRFAHVTDGLSHTALFAERRAGVDRMFISFSEFEAQCRRDPVRCVWHLDSAYVPGNDLDYAQACGDPSRRTSPLPTAQTSVRHYINPLGADYRHNLPPNSPSCYGSTQYPKIFAPSATSHHVGGVNLLLCDGSVRFVNDHVDLSTWWALGSRNGNDIVGAY